MAADVVVDGGAELLTLREVAEEAGVTYLAAVRWVSHGAYGTVLPSQWFGKRTRMVRRSDLEEFLEGHASRADGRGFCSKAAK